MCEEKRKKVTTEYGLAENASNEETVLVENSKPLWKRFVRLGAYLILVLTVFCFARPGFSPTTSMAPTIPSPCLCLTAPIYGMLDCEPKRFDVVSVKITDAQSTQLNVPPYEQLCKRVIGLGGEKLEIKGGVVYINDEPLQEDYLPEDYVPEATENFGPYYIPDGYMFLMGDNRNNSFDSRFLAEPYFSYESITAVTWMCIGRETHFIK